MLKTRNGFYELREAQSFSSFHLTNLDKLENLGVMVYFSNQWQLKVSLVDTLNLTDHVEDLKIISQSQNFCFLKWPKRTDEAEWEETIQYLIYIGTLSAR